jgi:uncharacterized membrane protein
MKSYKMFRPMFMLGVILMALVVFSYLLIPGWKSSLPHIIMLLVLGLVGLAAAIYDLQRLFQDIKNSNRKQ